MTEEFIKITPQQVLKLGTEFLGRLGRPPVWLHKRQFVIVVGGAPGSGKTIASHWMSSLSGSYHVQANSARHLLREHGLQWKENVHLVVKDVVNNILSRGWSVVLDGMMTEESQRQLVRDVADRHWAKTFFIAVTCDPAIAEKRARIRYADGQPSTFDDWRASPDMVEQYMADITTRAELLQKKLQGIPDNLDGVLRLSNDSGVNDLTESIGRTWKAIEQSL